MYVGCELLEGLPASRFFDTIVLHLSPWSADLTMAKMQMIQAIQGIQRRQQKEVTCKLQHCSHCMDQICQNGPTWPR